MCIVIFQVNADCWSTTYMGLHSNKFQWYPWQKPTIPSNVGVVILFTCVLDCWTTVFFGKLGTVDFLCVSGLVVLGGMCSVWKGVVVDCLIFYTYIHVYVCKCVFCVCVFYVCVLCMCVYFMNVCSVCMCALCMCVLSVCEVQNWLNCKFWLIILMSPKWCVYIK